MGIQQLHSIVTTGWPVMVGFHGHTNVYVRQKTELILSGCPCVCVGPVMCFLKLENLKMCRWWTVTAVVGLWSSAMECAAMSLSLLSSPSVNRDAALRK